MRSKIRGDSKLKSISEICIDITIAFMIHTVANFFILPYYSADITATAFTAGSLYYYLQIGLWFTLIGLARRYFMRRLFNRFGPNENAFSLSKKLVHEIAKRLQ